MLTFLKSFRKGKKLIFKNICIGFRKFTPQEKELIGTKEHRRNKQLLHQSSVGQVEVGPSIPTGRGRRWRWVPVWMFETWILAAGGFLMHLAALKHQTADIGDLWTDTPEVQSRTETVGGQPMAERLNSLNWCRKWRKTREKSLLFISSIHS